MSENTSQTKSQIDLLIPNFEDLGAQRIAINVANVLCKNHAITFVIFTPKLRVFFRILAYARHARQSGTTIAISFSPITNYCILFAKWRNPHLKTVIQEHAFPSLFLKDRENTSALYEFLFSRFFVKWYNRSDLFVTPAAAVKEDFEQNYGTKKGLMRVIRNPLDMPAIEKMAAEPVEDFVFKPDTRYLVNVGRLADQKNQKRLLDIFRAVREKRSDVELLIIGKGPLEADLRAQAASFGLADKVHFLGFKSNLYKYVARADAFCLTSNWEALPVVIGEAMVCRTPVIATDCRSGPSEMIENGKTGLLIPYGNDALFVEAILKLLDDSALQEKLREGAHEFAAREYSFEKCRQEYEDVIAKLSHVQGTRN